MGLTAHHLKRLADVYRANSASGGVKGIYEGVAAAFKHDAAVTGKLWDSRLDGLYDHAYLTESEASALTQANESARRLNDLYYESISSARNTDYALKGNLADRLEQQRRGSIDKIYSKVPKSVWEKKKALGRRRRERALARKDLIKNYGLKNR